MEEEEINQNGRNHNIMQTNSSIQLEGNLTHMPKNISIQTLDVQWESIESNLNPKEKAQNVKFLKYEDFFNQPHQNGKNKKEINFDFKSIIHPYDNGFEEFAKNKIDFLERMKLSTETPYSQSNNNSKENITPLNLDYAQEKEGGFSIIKKKNQLGQLTLSNDNSNKEKKSFLINFEEIKINHSKTRNLSRYYFNEDSLDSGKSNFKKKVNDMYKYINSSKNKKNFVNAKPYKANDNKNYQEIEQDDEFDKLFKGYLNCTDLPMKRKRANSLKNFVFSKEKKKDNNNDSNKYNLYTLTNERGLKKNQFIGDNLIEPKINRNVYLKIEDNKKLLNFLFKTNYSKKEFTK